MSSIVRGLLWYKIISGAIVATITGLLALYMQFVYRRGWVSDARRITSVSCHEKTIQTCHRPCRQCTTTCTSRALQACVVNVAGSEAHMRKTYASAPKPGAMATVYYDPKRADSTITLEAADVGAAVLFYAAVALVSGGYSYFLYKFRDDEDVRNVNAVLTGAEILSNVVGGGGESVVYSNA